MKACIVGVGAVGGLLAGWLARSGCSVSAIARGESLAALQRDGLCLHSAGHSATYAIDAHADACALGQQELVIVALKGHALRAAAATIAPLVGPASTVMVALNGVPWWLLERLDGPYRGRRIDALDPDGVLARAMPADRLIGCVVYPNCALLAPGVIEHRFGDALAIGTPGGAPAPGLAPLAAMLQQAGFALRVAPHIESTIWEKLLGNMTHNPLTALTGARCDQLLDDPLMRAFCVRAMDEAIAIGTRLGIGVGLDADLCNERVRALGAFTTSMLHDVRQQRPLEVDNLLAAVGELGRMTGVATPNIDALHGMMRLFGQVRGLY